MKAQFRVPRLPRHSARRLSLLGLTLSSSWALGVPGCYQMDQFSDAPGVLPEIDKKGVISAEELGIRGQWYVYGDAYGEPSSCMDVGMHRQQDCSRVDYPSVHLPSLDFPNQGGKMCLTGMAGRVLHCCRGATEPTDGEVEQCTGANEINCLDEDLDYSSMWGAGLGFDFDLEAPEDGERGYELINARKPWNAFEHRVIGISFNLEWHSAEKLPPLRIEFPVQIGHDVVLPQETDDADGKGTVLLDENGNLVEIPPGGVLPAGSSSETHPWGSPFWQDSGESSWDRSPVDHGKNVVLWENVFRPPADDNYLEEGELFADKLLGLQFHVIPADEGKGNAPFSFCISDLKFLTE